MHNKLKLRFLCMYFILRNEQAAFHAIDDFKEVSYQKTPPTQVEWKGRKWTSLGSIQGELNEGALKGIRKTYWIHLILTLGLALLFSKKVQEMKKTLETGFQSREILVEPSEVSPISVTFGKIFSPKGQAQQEKPKPVEGEGKQEREDVGVLPEHQADQEMLDKQKGEAEEEKKKLFSEIREGLYRNPFGKAKENAKEALKKYPEEAGKIFDEDFLKTPFAAELALETASENHTFLKTLDKEVLKQLALEKVDLLNFIPVDLSSYEEIVIAIVKSWRVDKVNNGLKPERWTEKIANEVIGESGMLKRLFDKESTIPPALRKKVVLEELKRPLDPEKLSPLAWIPIGDPDFKEFAIAAVQANASVFNKVKTEYHQTRGLGSFQISQKDFAEIEAHAYIAELAKNPNFRGRSYGILDEKLVEVGCSELIKSKESLKARGIHLQLDDRVEKMNLVSRELLDHLSSGNWYIVFNPEELNQESVEEFMKAHPEGKILLLKPANSFQTGEEFEEAISRFPLELYKSRVYPAPYLAGSEITGSRNEGTLREIQVKAYKYEDPASLIGATFKVLNWMKEKGKAF